MTRKIAVKCLEKTEEVLEMLIKEASHLARDSGKPFLSKKDLHDAWYYVADIYSEDILKRAEQKKIVIQPRIGYAKINRMLEKHFPQQLTGIKLMSMRWAVRKSTKELLYNIAREMETDCIIKEEE